MVASFSTLPFVAVRFNWFDWIHLYEHLNHKTFYHRRDGYSCLGERKAFFLFF